MQGGRKSPEELLEWLDADPDEVIDGWSLNRLEYPFTRRGMTAREYAEEFSYYLSVGVENIKSGKYEPLWKQRQREG